MSLWQYNLIVTTDIQLQVVPDCVPRWSFPDPVSGTDWCTRQETRVLELGAYAVFAVEPAEKNNYVNYVGCC